VAKVAYTHGLGSTSGRVVFPGGSVSLRPRIPGPKSLGSTMHFSALRRGHVPRAGKFQEPPRKRGRARRRAEKDNRQAGIGNRLASLFLIRLVAWPRAVRVAMKGVSDAGPQGFPEPG
jgi:hypothetical protein